MRKTTKIALLAAAMAVGTADATAKTTKTVTLHVVETSDVHGCFFPYDFMENRPLKGSLARVSTYVNRLRKECGGRLLLIDNGDILQGQPCTYWSNYMAPENENLAASVVNYMKYDAQAVGNHDVETGRAVYDKWISEVRCPMLGANIVDKETGQPYVKPYSVHMVDGVKVVVIGLLTPAIPHWLSESLWQGLEFQEMTACARKWMEHVRKVERPDLILGLFHSGWEGGITTPEYDEDASRRVAQEVPGFDIVFFGHDHIAHNRWVTNTEGKRVLCLDPSCFAMNVADAKVTLTYEDGRLAGKEISGVIADISDEEVDQRMTAFFKPQTDSVKAFVARRIGTFTNSITTRDCFFGSSAFCDFIHNLQMKISGADISLNAPLSFDCSIEAGPVTVADMFKLYKYENLLVVLNMTGREVRRHLEMSYALWTNTMATADDHLMLFANTSGDQQRMGFKNYTFNFDSACGIDYEVDVTKPEGEKVRILRMTNGQPFREDAWYRVVMNSYRANGGGELITRGAGIPKDSIARRIVFQTDRDQRYYLMKEIERMGVVSPEANNNWRFVPEAWTKPAARRDRKRLFP